MQFLFSSESIDGAPCSLEHTIVEDTLMSDSDLIQTRGQRENDMKHVSLAQYQQHEDRP